MHGSWGVATRRDFSHFPIQIPAASRYGVRDFRRFP